MVVVAATGESAHPAVGQTQARIIDGAALASQIRAEVAQRISALRAANPKFCPHLAIVQAGSNPQAIAYVHMKMKLCKEVGILSTHVQLPGNVTVHDVLDTIERLNEDKSVSGVMIQIPLGDEDQIGPAEEQIVIEKVRVDKDVDGFHPFNVGRLSSLLANPFFAPCTPMGVIRLIEKTGVSIANAHAVVLGTHVFVLGERSTFGNPVAAMLRNMNATVTYCRGETKNLESYLKTADIVVVGLGKPEFVRGEMLKPGCVVIDLGLNYVPDRTEEGSQRLVGDVHYESASKVAGWITPVPGGIGPMTFVLLVANTLRSAEAMWKNDQENTALPS